MKKLLGGTDSLIRGCKDIEIGWSEILDTKRDRNKMAHEKLL